MVIFQSRELIWQIFADDILQSTSVCNLDNGVCQTFGIHTLVLPAGEIERPFVLRFGAPRHWRAVFVSFLFYPVPIIHRNTKNFLFLLASGVSRPPKEDYHRKKHKVVAMADPKPVNRSGDGIGKWTDGDCSKHFPFHLYEIQPTLADPFRTMEDGRAISDEGIRKEVLKLIFEGTKDVLSSYKRILDPFFGIVPPIMGPLDESIRGNIVQFLFRCRGPVWDAAAILAPLRNGPIVIETEGVANSDVKRAPPAVPPTSPSLVVKRLSPYALMPTRGTPGAAGYDLSSATELILLPAHGKVIVPTDLMICVPPGTYGRIAPRSGFAWKSHVDVGAGVIDADYRGNVGVVLFNHSATDIKIMRGDRVAQLILEKIETVPIVEMTMDGDDEHKTVRGAAGFGSTGMSAP